MKTLVQLFAIALVCTAGFAHAGSISEQIPVERYTILSNQEVEVASGNLLNSGKFRPVGWSPTPTWGIDLSDVWFINGRPVVHEMMYDALKIQGLIPKWVRSDDSFDVGFSTYVIVAIKGKENPNPRPTIVRQPTDERVLLGGTGFFFVDAEPWFYTSCQWYFKNKPIPGATSDMLMVTNVTKAQTGLYHAVMTLGNRSASTRKAMLSVVSPVTIKTQPKSQTVKAGKNVTLRVTATGTPPFTYQWYRNEQIITNATKSFYTISKAKPENSGSYDVFVGNGVSWVLSAPATVTVNP